ncbi:hypothetical protein ULMS_24510 [Patiriisocius marinistellae]|uniref:Uncharacterized protein n=1 Tax=Patiriisocius marinistellae TaxID=2494560 RepID=A0A5J4FY08_9FLAO|nr:alkaline phosphatase family protein [Patiriisocius marinistellae]GEQ86943.1 hypothetical protein ULMS_24510 [Patiriisocius marinistellae]
MKKNKVLLIGWDAADWKIIGPLIAKGLMPNLKKMIQNGVYGNMSTMDPPYSPMLWSSVATGKTPDKHGVLGFIEVSPQNSLRPVTAHSRKSRALWNILHNQNLKSNMVGWWPSFPAEPINGVIVTDKFQKVGKEINKLKVINENAIHPQSLASDLKKLRMHPSEITKEHILPFIPKAAKVDQTNPEKAKKNGLIPFAQVMAENVSIHNAATYLLDNTEWDFMGIYYDYIDHMCHGFMKFHPPKLARIEPEDFEIYNDVVNSAYRFQDMMLGRTLDMVDSNTTVIVMSDHGFESGDKRILEMPKVNAAPALDHRQFGMFVAMGPNIKKNEKIFGISLIDIAPTILNHFNLPVGKDMDGKVILDMYEKPKAPKYINSWEDIEGDFGELKKEDESVFSDEETMQQLIELGYIDKPDDKIEVAVHNTKCDLKHNLARVYSGKRDFISSKELLLELVQEKSSKHLAHYYIDLINVCLRLKEFNDAEKFINEFKEIDTDVKFNIHYLEADMFIGKGNLRGAEKVLKEKFKNGGNSETLYRLGEVFKAQSKFDLAKECFEKAIDNEPDKAKFNKALAEVLIELGEYEEAAEYAFTSIELVKFYPEAHYVLGRALEKLGDVENAKLAFETAAKLRPQTYHRAQKAAENMSEKLAMIELNDKITFKHRKNQIVIVSGLPRSGTSLMMQMLNEGGLQPLVDGKREADVSNPKGYFEFEPVMSIHKDNSWLDRGQDKAVKIVAPLLKYIDPQFRYKIIFMKRDLNEIIKSQRVMTGKDAEIMPVNIYNSYVKLLGDIDKWKENEPGVEVIYMDYKDVLENPTVAASKVKSFVGTDLDIDKMASCIDVSLYRNKITTTAK